MGKRGNLVKPARQEQTERPIRWRRYQQLFLIVCEDSVTEPAYFNLFAAQFPPDSMYVKPVGAGRDPEGVVQRAVREKALVTKESGKEVDFTWVVFDKDDADLYAGRTAAWNRAHQEIATNKFRTAMSNEVFELWFLLHFEDVDPTVALPRQTVYQRLGAAIQGFPEYAAYIYDHYTDGGAVVPVIAAIGNQEEATRRAELLLAYHGAKPPIQANPSTGVHLLVGELIDWIRYYNWQPE
ncbi:RloB family protein [Pedobacter terrae]|uniref:RloB family protein n=1 Tax=Pedobacter terrae TaxID=405671 RepID=UPI002FFAB6CE